MRLRHILIALLIVCGICAQDVPLSPDRVALVICNGNYPGNKDDENDFRLSRLPSAAVDKDTITKALRATGFTVEAHLDKTAAEMKSIIQGFSAKYKGKREVLVHISSHGFREGNENYITGIDTDVRLPEAETALKATLTGEALTRKLATLPHDLAEERAISLTFLNANLKLMTPQNITAEEAQRHVRIVLLDCCRNPLQSPIGSDGAFVVKGMSFIRKSGLGEPEKIAGGFTAFAAQEGSFSFAPPELPGGKPTPSFFTASFAKRMVQPGTIKEIFNDVQMAVFTETKKLARSSNTLPQKPAAYEDLNPEVPFAFVPSKPFDPERDKLEAKKNARGASQNIANQVTDAGATSAGIPIARETSIAHGVQVQRPESETVFYPFRLPSRRYPGRWKEVFIKVELPKSDSGARNYEIAKHYQRLKELGKCVEDYLPLTPDKSHR